MTDLGDEYRKNFQENLKSFRLNRGLTQAELSIEANYDATYVGKLERGASSPSFETIIRLGNALDLNPLKLLRPSRAHLDIREDIRDMELEELPYNPLDIQIFDSLPYAMGIITDEGTPVYINDTFVRLTGIERDEIKERKLWELSCWEFVKFRPEEMIETIKRVYFETHKVHYELKSNGENPSKIDLFFYPTPVDYEPEDRMMWIFEIRRSNHADVEFPLTIEAMCKANP